MKLLLMALLLLTACLKPLAAAEQWRLEGVVEDKQNPAQSVAVINGNPYQAGDVLGSFRISQIGSHYAKLADLKTGKEDTLFVKEAPKASPPPPASSPQSLIDKAKTYISNPGQAVNRAWELKAIRDIAIINNAAVKYYEKNGFFPTGLRQLTLEGFLPQDYENGKINKYQFYFRNKPQEPDSLRLHADPADSASAMRYFFVGADAVIRESFDKPATVDSPPHQYFGQDSDSGK
jgi:hypothetical protein